MTNIPGTRLYKAGGQAWPDVNKISNFRNGLNSALRSRLAQQLTLPRVYNEFLQTAQQLSSKTAVPPYIQAPKIAHDPMDISELIIGTFTIFLYSPLPDPLILPKILARSIILELHDDYKDSGNDFNNGSYNRTRSELESKVDRIVAD